MHTYHCISPTPTTQAGLPYHTQAHTSAYTLYCIRRVHSQAPERGCTMHGKRRYARQSPEKVRIQGDPLRALYGIYPPPYYQKT